MKITILTHQLATNYGGLLQNYALQVALKGLGHEPTTLNHYSTTPIRVKLLSVVGRVLARIKGKNIPLRGWANKKELAIISQNTNLFINKYILKTEAFAISNREKFRDLIADAIIVGSDQVWRASEKTSVFFLSYITDIKIPKIAYAASFGVDFWEYGTKETALCKGLIKSFTGVSVREESGIDFCRDYLGTNAKFVLDPTLLIDKSYYETIANTEQDNNQSEYLMVYILDESEEKTKIVEQVAKQLGLKPYTVMAKKYFKQVGHKGIEQCVFPPVETWLRGFMNAKYVITDSFHGTVFSIIFQKDFISISNKGRGTGRFTSLLGLLRLEYRLINSSREVQGVINKSINYTEVNAILYDKRKDSIEFLRTFLS